MKIIVTYIVTCCNHEQCKKYSSVLLLNFFINISVCNSLSFYLFYRI